MNNINNFFTLKFNIQNLIDYSLLYLILLCTSGFLLHEKNFAYSIPFILSGFLFIKNNKRINIEKFKIGIILTSIIVISSLLNKDDLWTMLFSVVCVITSIIYTSLYTKEEFANIFSNLVFILCLGSTLCFFIALIFPNFMSLFPLIATTEEKAFFTGLSFLKPATYYVSMRNQGIFWEPGVFQTFIILAFLVEISKYGLKRKKNTVVYILAMLTTMSSVGYVSLIPTIFLWLRIENKNKKFAVLKYISIFLLATYVCYLLYSLLPQGTSNRTIDKILNVYYGNTDNISVLTRLNSIYYSIEGFLISPLLGIGRSGLANYWNINESGLNIMTFTPGNWLARYGVFFGSICVCGFLSLRDRLFSSVSENIISYIILILIISTEAYTTNIAIFIFIMYGLSRNIRRP